MHRPKKEVYSFNKYIKRIRIVLYAFIFIFIFILSLQVGAQSKKPEDYGFRHIQVLYKNDTVDVLIKSKKREEEKVKPLFLFCQGSLPQPLIIYNAKDIYPVFPFSTDELTTDFHLVIISKPFIPLITDVKSLANNFTYKDSTGQSLQKYRDRNLLDYYVNRNKEVLQFLQKQKWVSKNQLVVAGHSEGSTVAAKLALNYPKVTHLIYSGGNSFGRIMAIIEQDRAIENEENPYAEEDMNYWQRIVADPSNMKIIDGDTYKCTYQFSIPPKEYLEKLKIPVLISYGTKDISCPFNDFFRVDMIKQKKLNFTFKTYIGTEHNYFPVLPDGKINYEIYNWDKVAHNWYRWLKEKIDK